MFNVVALIVGVISLILAALAFIPFLGWANWLIIPVAIVGAGLGQLSSGSKAGRNLCMVVIVIGVLRLMLGGGLL